MAALRPNMPSGSWRVTGQQQNLEPGPGGQLVQGVRVSFTTGKGAQGSVFVSLATFNPDNVKAAIAALAHQLDLVHDLTSS